MRLACIAGGLFLSILLVFAGLRASQANAQMRPVQARLGADAILSDPRPLLDQTVAVEGEVGRIEGARALVLRSHTVRQGLLVLLADGALPGGARLRSGQSVRVTGTVRMLDRSEAQALEARLGVDLSHDSHLAMHRDDPYILALRVEPEG